MILKRRAVRLALKELAKDAEDSHVIARRLKDAGITGGIGMFNCPIAQYLRRTTGVKARVLPNSVTNGWLSRVPVKIPGTVSAFIKLYDDGYYPELESYREMEMLS